MKESGKVYKSKGLRKISVQKVKDYFVENKYGIKNEIAKSTNLSLATITNILKELEFDNYIERVEDCKSTGGRKAKRYKICGQYMYFALLQLQIINEHTKINYRIIDLDSVIWLENEIIKKEFSFEKLVTIIKSMKENYDFQYLSISIPAIVDNGFVTKSDIKAFNDFNLEKEIENVFNIKVEIENDVNTAVLGYVHSENIKKQSIAFIYQPDNNHSGCGLFINNNIVYGATHFAGELAYLPNGNLEKQKRLLKENPLCLLVNQIQSIIAIINPSHMVVYTVCVKQVEVIKELKKHIPKKHLPQILFIDDMKDYVFIGMMYLCLESSKFKN